MALSNEQVLLKLRKSAHSSLSYKAMAAALKDIGWTVEVHKKDLWAPVRSAFDFRRGGSRVGDVGAVEAAIAEMAGIDCDGIHASYCGKFGDALPVHGREETLQQIAAALKPGMQAGNFRIVEVVGFDTDTKTGAERESLMVRIEANGPGVRFVSPRGDDLRCTGSKVPTYTSMPLAESHGLIEDICAFLGMPTPAEEKAERDSVFDHADVTNTGSCPCCFGLHKLLADGTMVHHGFQRPGDGNIYGDCFGVKFRPFEVSNEGTVAYAKALRQAQANTEKTLAFLQSDKCVEISEEVSEGFGRNRTTKTVVHQRGTEDFERVVARRIRSAESQIAQLKAHASQLEKLAADWQPMDLPEVRAARGEKLYRFGYRLMKKAS